MASSILSLLVVVLCCCSSFCSAAYSLQTNYSGVNFFNGWTFFTDGDPTHGYVNYVSQQQAQSEGLIKASASSVYIGADNSRVSSGRGRDSVRITSTASYNSGLFAIDLLHMPEGCGTWPAFWMVGPDWPNNGEIDIIEGVNTQTADQTTLHTNQGCNMGNESTSLFSGHWGTTGSGKPSTDCWVNDPNQYSNAGCGIIGTANSYGPPFNNQGGGVYAFEWTNTFMRSFYFPRNRIPADLVSDKPNPSSWGLPYAYFTLGTDCPPSKFKNNQIVINLTFCGDWAGNVFDQMCPGMGSCQTYVQNNPGKFVNAYWNIQYLKVYQNR
jgi:hypothetical protein